MRLRFVLSLLVLATCGSLFVHSQSPSTPEQRARFVEIAQKVEADPISPSLKPEREWAFKWLVQVPDVHVELCADLITPLFGKKYKYGPELTLQNVLGAGAFVVKNPDQESNHFAANQAALMSVLNAYQVILKSDPKARLKTLDDLVEAAKVENGLDNHVREATKKCDAPKKSGD